MMRFTGPVVRQNQHLFASDWLTQVDEDLNDILTESPPTGVMRGRQNEYLAHSQPVTAEMVAAGPLRSRFWNNSIAMLGPVL